MTEDGTKKSKARRTPRAKGRPRREAPGVGAALLVRQASDLVDQVAPASITMAMLARYAHVDPALIRYYFKDRNSLLRAVAVHLTGELQAAGVPDSAGDGMADADRITARIAAQLKFRADHPNYHRLMLEEVGAQDDPDSRDYFRQQVETGVGRYRRFLDAGAADGTLRETDAAFLYLAIIGLCEAFVTSAPLLDALGLTQRSPEQLLEDYADFISDLVIKGIQR